MSDLTPTSPETQQHSPPSLPFQLPADYYSTPVGRSMFPRWVPMGCGAAALVLVLLLFLAGVFASRGGLGRAMDFLLGMMQSQMITMYSDDVPAQARKSLESEMDNLRENIRTERVPVPKLDPVMTTLREAISDRKLTRKEVEDLRAKVKEANKPEPKKR